MDQIELDRKAALNQMVLRQLERMGLLGAGLHTGSIKAGLTNSGDYADRQQALVFLDLMKMSDPNKSPEEMKDFVPASEAMKAKIAKDPLYAVNTQAAVLDGRLGGGEFTGPGHQKSEGEFSPRSTWDWLSGKKYEASEGDRYINRYNNDLRLAEALSKPNHDIEQGLHYLNPYASNRSILHWANGTNDTEHAQALDQHIQDQGLEDQALGEGYRPLVGSSNSMNFARHALEALEDPNSNAGAVMHGIGERPYQLIRHGATRSDHRDDRGTWKAAQDSFDAKGISNGGTQYLPEDYDDWRDQQAAYRSQKGLYEELEPHSYQDSYRANYGKYPSYLGQKVTELGEMLPDLVTLISFGGGVAAKGLKAGAKAAALELATQDTPILGTVMGGTEAFNKERPDIKDWLSQDRTDLPTEDADQFRGRLKQETRNRLEASKTLQGLLK